MEPKTEIRRTVRIKLETSDGTERLFLQTITQYRWAANYIVDVGWDESRDEPKDLSRNELHERTYEEVRNRTELHAAHVQLARSRAREALQAVTEHHRQGRKAGCPKFTATFLDFNDRSATLEPEQASLATIDGRETVPFVVPENEDTPYHRYYLNPAFRSGRSTLLRKDGDWYLHVTMERKRSVNPPEPDTPAVLGVDLGIANLAVTSTGTFWSGGRVTHWRTEYGKRRQSLQRCGSRSAHELLPQLSQRIHDRIDQYLHTVANGIVDEAVEYGCPVIAFEDLTDIYQKMQQWPNMRTWAYRSLVEYVRYKGKREGLTTATVDPEHTSSRCSTCGHTDPRNRPTQDRFKCSRCGYQNHADYNAAKNIGLTYLRGSQTGNDGGVPTGVRVNGGIITEEGYQRLQPGT